MKEDITQPHRGLHHARCRCGLVMKEDITQPSEVVDLELVGCGLVMKEDITQQNPFHSHGFKVVVW